MYSIRDAGTDRKRWVIEREGYHFAVAAFHDRADAERYLAKLLSRTQHAA